MVLIFFIFLFIAALITKDFLVLNAEILVCLTFILFMTMVLVYFKQVFVDFFEFKRTIILKELNLSKSAVIDYLVGLYNYLMLDFRSLNLIFAHLLFLKYAKWACLAQSELLLLARLEFYILEQLKRLVVLEFIFQHNISFAFSFGIEARVRTRFAFNTQDQNHMILIASIKALS
jgi:hypothetical protein